MLCIRLVFNEHDRLAGEQSCSICLGRVSLRQVSIDSEEQAKTETLGDASRLLLKDSGGFRWHDFGRGHVPEPKPAIKQSWGDPIPMFQMGRHGIALVPTAGKQDRKSTRLNSSH